jgi:uracil-DNA glycosylase
MSTPSKSPLVYLEDLEQPSSQAAAASTNEEKPSAIAASSDNDENAKTKPTPTSNGKRQRTLLDMFGSTPGQGPEAPSKKPKVAAAAASSARHKPSATSATGAQFPPGESSSGQQALNSIPFSLTEYTTSFTEDQKRLLKLECETMGKSW